jgi:hypothetical protein
MGLPNDLQAKRAFASHMWRDWQKRNLAEADRREERGLVKCDVWVKPERLAEIRELAEYLTNEQPTDPDAWVAFIRFGNKAAEAQRKAVEDK